MDPRSNSAGARVAPGLASTVLALAALGGVGGCATTGAAPGGAPDATAASPTDPWEGWNRRVFAFNDAVDRAVLKPVAQVYRRIVPQPIREGIGNVFANLAEPWSAVNALLQGKPFEALDTGMRFGLNTIAGLGGFFDVASATSLERVNVEDFGQTLGVWGIPAGPYLVLPILGPSSVRDAAALPADLTATSPSLVLSESRERYGASALQLVNTRARLLDVEKVVDDIALDRYVLIRDGFLARRRSAVYDGDPPEPPADDPTKPLPGDAAKPAPGELARPAAPRAAAASPAPAPAASR